VISIPVYFISYYSRSQFENNYDATTSIFSVVLAEDMNVGNGSTRFHGRGGTAMHGWVTDLFLYSSDAVMIIIINMRVPTKSFTFASLSREGKPDEVVNADV
jgi:hypothetical protein